MYKPGDRLVITSPVVGNGVTLVTDDGLVYLGKSQARIVTGEHKGTIVILTITSPVRRKHDNKTTN